MKIRRTLSDWHQDLVILLEKRNAGEMLSDFEPTHLVQAWNEGRTPDQFLRERTQANSPKRQTPVIGLKVNDAPAQTVRPTKACPFCGETILAIATKCKHCGANLNTVERNRKVALGLALVVVILVAVYMLVIQKRNDAENTQFLEGMSQQSQDALNGVGSTPEQRLKARERAYTTPIPQDPEELRKYLENPNANLERQLSEAEKESTQRHNGK